MPSLTQNARRRAFPLPTTSLSPPSLKRVMERRCVAAQWRWWQHTMRVTGWSWDGWWKMRLDGPLVSFFSSSIFFLTYNVLNQFISYKYNYHYRHHLPPWPLLRSKCELEGVFSSFHAAFSANSTYEPQCLQKNPDGWKTGDDDNKGPKRRLGIVLTIGMLFFVYFFHSTSLNTNLCYISLLGLT